MFKLIEFISDLFSRNHSVDLQYETGYSLDEAIELIVENIDLKLRLVPDYNQKIQQEVITSLNYISQLVDQLPGPLDVSRKTFVSDPDVRAYFATPDVLQDALSCGAELKTFFRQPENSSADECFALLCINKEEKQLVGTALEGDMLRHDILQTAVNFFDYRVMSPAIDEGEVRSGIKRCIFDGLLTYAMQYIVRIKVERRDLSHRRRILHSKLREKQRLDSGLSAMVAQANLGEGQSINFAAQLEQAEARLTNMTGDMDILSFYLEEIRKVLAHPDKFIQLNVACFRLNDMGIKVSDSDTQSANRVCFSELEITRVMKHVVTLIQYRRDDIRCGKLIH